ncbi:unconventional myosin-XIX isoform X4 [Ictidomys tridecemlineatus]|uniref:unconventional myosin-XIX isoform X4 n=1 Tax=Ictidomys tridecemlineatus TaxID=43179 RepID=UPI001A9F285F|nr:unconventional myosin-XIX isoform X4 [Ictidomys tridecemlineatus]
MLQQLNGHSSSSHDQSRVSLREDIQEFLSGEAPLHQLDDLTKVNPVTLETVLRCLQARYMMDTFYTNAGCTLVALNPFKPVPGLYSPEMMREYHAASQPQKLKPHIFTVGEQTYRNVKSLIEPVNQSIVVSGESGAGKTWTSRCLMKFYAVVATSPTSWENHKIAERIEQRILNSNPVMEAFGNACTLRNDNSSRFGKFIQLQLNRAQQMTGAAVQTYLLEKTRVACQASSERNFHIFYQICKGASEEERVQWHLPKGSTFSWLPNPERILEEDCFEVTREAMLHLGIDTPTQNNIFKVLAGLLHLGNVQFADSEDEAQPCQLTEEAKCSVRTSASLLQLPENMLLETLRIRTIRAGRQQQVFRKACSRAECDTRRDCLAKLVYARLFDWLVLVINSSIYADPDSWTTFIGLLDVYGFESFPDNSLEQLCINYANEKLQQHFVAHYLRAQQDPVPPELTGLLQQSQHSLLTVLFPTDPKEKTQEKPSGQNRTPALTVVSKFKASLEQLLRILQNTTPHYIRCIKPNSQGQPQSFLQEEVLSQLEACGLVETIHISAAGFPIRVSHQNFMERYELLRRLCPRASSSFHNPYSAKEHSEQPPQGEAATLQTLLQDILHILPALTGTAATPVDSAECTPAPLQCGRTKVFMTDFMLELLENGRTQVLEQCARCIQCGWRQHQRRKQKRQRRAATLIQAAVRSWLTRKYIQRLHIAATVIKHAWQKWRIRMAFLASKELDGLEEKHFSQAHGSPNSSPLPPMQTRLLGAIIRLWPLGLVLANAAVGIRGFQRKLVVHACLQLPLSSSRSSSVQTAQQDQAGVRSIRALPQGSIRFHCRKSPLRYADTCPEPSPSSVTGFNQILLEKHRPIHV